MELLLYTTVRCSVVYPDPSHITERHVTMATFICQYVLPTLVTSLAYGRIACRLWWRGSNVDRLAGGDSGSGLLPTERQRLGHERARRRSVALLASVVVVFSISWLPLNLYHVLTDFHPDTATFHYNRFLNSICIIAVFYVFTGRAARSCSLFLVTGRFFVFFAPQGRHRHVTPIKVLGAVKR